jgi:hypothetical protein
MTINRLVAKPKVPRRLKPAKVRLVACIPPELMAHLEDLQYRLRQKACWKARSTTSVSALVTKALQEYLHAHG